MTVLKGRRYAPRTSGVKTLEVPGIVRHGLMPCYFSAMAVSVMVKSTAWMG